MKSGLNVFGIFLLAGAIMLLVAALRLDHPGKDEKIKQDRLNLLYQDFTTHPEQIKYLENELAPIISRRAGLEILSRSGAVGFGVFAVLAFITARAARTVRSEPLPPSPNSNAMPSSGSTPAH
jgi:hypothetical protein